MEILEKLPFFLRAGKKHQTTHIQNANKYRLGLAYFPRFGIFSTVFNSTYQTLRRAMSTGKAGKKFSKIVKIINEPPRNLWIPPQKLLRKTTFAFGHILSSPIQFCPWHVQTCTARCFGKGLFTYYVQNAFFTLFTKWPHGTSLCLY